ncbi:MAG: hypothetical protein ACOX6N_04855 [Patescibacteria group bacterium]|jgi:hypothetical protein
MERVDHQKTYYLTEDQRFEYPFVSDFEWTFYHNIPRRNFTVLERRYNQQQINIAESLVDLPGVRFVKVTPSAVQIGINYGTNWDGIDSAVLQTVNSQFRNGKK